MGAVAALVTSPLTSSPPGRLGAGRR